MPHIECLVPMPQQIKDALRTAFLACQISLGLGEGSRSALIYFEKPEDVHLIELLEANRGQGLRSIALTPSERNLTPGVYWQLLRHGADEVIAWDGLGHPALDVALRMQRWEQVDAILHDDLVRKNLVGTAPVWLDTLRQVIEAASFTDAPVLIGGESGTGKELVSRLIHTLDPRERKTELIIVDCTTIVPELSGSEFFGHEKGAFTNAVNSRDGAFALADGGTLFLDEVGELPLRLQAELLRVIQEKTYKRVGGNRWFRSDFRLISATNRNLEAEVQAGRFRQDLFYRIAGWHCRLPALSQRKADIPQLVSYFLQQQFPQHKQVPGLTRPVRDYLLQRDYPGNVRELSQLVMRLASRHSGQGDLTIGDIPPDEYPDPAHRQGGTSLRASLYDAVLTGTTLKEIGRQATESAIDLALELEQGNLHRAALRLGVSDRALQLRRANRQD